MSAREENWIMVRLRRSAHAKLMKFRDRMERLYTRAELQISGGEDGVISINALIEELLRRDEAAQERSRKARDKRVRKRLEAFRKEEIRRTT